MTTYTKFSLAAKIRLHEKFTSEIFYWLKYPDLRYTAWFHIHEIPPAYNIMIEITKMHNN